MQSEIVTHSLLEKASLIKRNRIRELNSSGENFNVFSVLRLEYNEARLHSLFIADLLNPHGSHGQKTLFLKKLLEKVNLPALDSSSIAQAKVYVEEYIGPIPKDYMSGGLIDIVIKIPHNQVIVIENKINAGDQKHQLIRYKNAYRDAYLLYLTKDGCKPSSISTHIEGKEMIVDFDNNPKHSCISYKVHILEWLEACYQEITRLPLLRENIFQYIVTIKKITNQSTDNYMSNEIASAIISSNAHLDGFFTLRGQKVVKAVEQKLLYKFIDEMEGIAKELGLVYVESDINREELGHREYDTEITFHIPNSPFSIALGFETWRSDFCIGLGAESEIEDKELKQRLSKHFTDLFGKDSDYPNWYYLLHFENSKHGDKYLSVWHEGLFDVWGAVNDGTVAKRMKWYFVTFIQELQALGLIAS